MLNINTPKNEIFNLTISDVTGKIVLNQKLNAQNNKIEVTTFVSGIYFVRVFNETNNTYQKLIIE